VEDTRTPADRDLTDEAERGANSIAGYGDDDREPHPLQVEPSGERPAEEPEDGRGRDPELGNVPDGGRVGESAGR